MNPFRLVIIAVLSLFSLSLTAAPLPSVADIQHKAKQYYDTRGEWAGTFIIQRFLQQRIADNNDTRFVAHIAYEWAFKRDPSRSGTDERTFTFEWRDDQWQVTAMGENHSGKL